MTAAAPAPTPLLAGFRVLVVEDRFLIAEEMERTVRALGGKVVGPAANLEAALALLEREAVDLALLDVNLDKAKVFPVATELTRRSIPFIFATGYERWVIPPEFQSAPYIEKPVSVRALSEAIEQLALTRHS